jgi:hypothetical protein
MTDVEKLTIEMAIFMDTHETDIITKLTECKDGSLDIAINDEFYDMVTEKYPELDFNETFTEIILSQVNEVVDNVENEENSEKA